MRIPSERIVRAFHYASGSIEPAPSRHIRDGIGVPNDEGAVREMVIQDLIVPLRLASVTVDGVAEPFGRHVLEMHSLAGEWAEARGGRLEAACGFDSKRCGLATSTGRISSRAMITRAPRLVSCHILMAKSFFKRIQPCEAG